MVAGVLSGRQPDEVVLFRRSQGERHAGVWEFPGGKLEPGESLEAALIREWMEELRLVIKVAEHICTVSDRRIRLHAFRVLSDGSAPSLTVHDSAKVVSVDAAPPEPINQVDRQVFNALKV